ncbi:MAG: Integral membrane protein, partial [uncultured Frankineae bacterium]
CLTHGSAAAPAGCSWRSTRSSPWPPPRGRVCSSRPASRTPRWPTCCRRSRRPSTSSRPSPWPVERAGWPSGRCCSSSSGCWPWAPPPCSGSATSRTRRCGPRTASATASCRWCCPCSGCCGCGPPA